MRIRSWKCDTLNGRTIYVAIREVWLNNTEWRATQWTLFIETCNGAPLLEEEMDADMAQKMIDALGMIELDA